MWINLNKNIHNKYQQHFKKQLLYLKSKTKSNSYGKWFKNWLFIFYS